MASIFPPVSATTRVFNFVKVVPSMSLSLGKFRFSNPVQSNIFSFVQDDVRFHLYINTAPCGDARIFSPHEPENPVTVTGTDANVDRHPNRKARGQLRTKIESGEGTIPVKSSDGIQTWDGVMQGARLLTMSCSGRIFLIEPLRNNRSIDFFYLSYYPLSY